MANLLYLVHRLPYPPNKGDKVRSYHLLQHLRANHRVFLGTFVDDRDDEQHVPHVRSLCQDLCALPLNPGRARLRSVQALLQSEPLTLHYYRDERLHRWVSATIAANGIDAAIVFSSSMAQYAERVPQLPMLVDLVDVDSAKWTDYAAARAWPMSWVYGREGERLLAYERSVVARSSRAFLVTDAEIELFGRLAPECASKVEALCNGVDADFFAPAGERVSPFAADETPIVFTGAMDYWPNVDAVSWFAREVLPALRQQWPRVRFHIVGRSPTAAVRALASDAVQVSGTVPDVRPYLQHAAAVVAPLRLARGVQNKVLEAMALARPVVAASSCAGAIAASPGRNILTADLAATYVAQLGRLIETPASGRAIGDAARRFVVERYSWTARLALLDTAVARAIGSHEAVAA
ncbi:MAG: TIGR03087 family PEP-CTERM/XrtA system glycosyltransferase [Rhizobacter sp.]|nr:TIGR03087 family PEP-CTERM/XrtA system glycosyltransferase [Rhizobacter sp.]